MNEVLIEFEHSKERLLRHFHIANLLHSFLSSLLLLEQFAFTRDVTTVTLRRDILSHALYRLASNNLCTDGGLNSNVKLLPRNQVFKLLAHPST